MINVLFVCLGNICRSPTAQGIFEKKITLLGLTGKFNADSAGTGNWHVGEKPDDRAIKVAAVRGYKIDHFRARQVIDKDFSYFHHIIAMDKSNLGDLLKIAPISDQSKIRLMLSSEKLSCVPDPYYGTESDFYSMIDLLEDAIDDFIRSILAANEDL